MLYKSISSELKSTVVNNFIETGVEETSKWLECGNSSFREKILVPMFITKDLPRDDQTRIF